MKNEDLRQLVKWSDQYRPDWDEEPGQYVASGKVRWGRSRRLGLLILGECKAYLGVQHIDPSLPGWEIYQEPQTRFFASMFVAGECVALRTVPNMGAAIDLLLAFLGGESQAL